MLSIKLIVFVLVCEGFAAEQGLAKTEGRQKRLLFYDEEGNLVKTYSNPLLRTDLAHNAEKAALPPMFLNSFYNLLRLTPLTGATAYMIPVSDDVIQELNKDPVYQNKLFTIPKKELVMSPNIQCEGKRTQVIAKDCRNFLNCWDGWAFEQECPDGLLFSREGYCDYPQNVECGNRVGGGIFNKPSLPAASPAIPPAPELHPVVSLGDALPSAPSLPPAPALPPAFMTPQCSSDFETFRNEEQCSEFFVCVNRVPVRFKCPAELAYSQVLGVCDYAYNVDCRPSLSVPMTQGHSEFKPKPCDDPMTSPNSKEPAVLNAPANFSGKEKKGVALSSQSWLSSHEVMSRQEAIRLLKLGGISNLVA